MKGYFRMNVMFKVSTIIILGYFIFDLLFGIVTGNFGMYGSTGSASSHHVSGGGTASVYSFDMIINALLLLLVKLLIVLLLLVLISGMARLMKDTWNREDQKNAMSAVECKDREILVTLIGALIIIIVLYSIFKAFYMIPSVQTTISWNNSNSYGNFAINIHNFYNTFFNTLLYITAIILGVELFNHINKKQRRR